MPQGKDWAKGVAFTPIVDSLLEAGERGEGGGEEEREREGEEEETEEKEENRVAGSREEE